MNTIVPAIIAENRDKLLKRVNAVKNEVEKIHIDIMDGTFVYQTSNWFEFSLPKFKGEYEAHLMVASPLQWLQGKNFLQFDIIIIHAEAGQKKEILNIIDVIKQQKKEVILAFNPKTLWEPDIDLIEKTDGIQIMTVYPGKYSEAFIPRIIKKIENLRKHFPILSLQVDGGMNEKNIQLAKKAGADIFIVGSRIFENPNPLKALWDLEKAVK